MNIDEFYHALETCGKPAAARKFSSVLKNMRNLCQLEYARYLYRKVFHDGEGKLREYQNHVTEHEKEYRVLYDLLSDDLSKKTLLATLQYRITGTYDNTLSDFVFSQYFDKDIIRLQASDVFVDCGGCMGDTTEHYLLKVPDFRKIYLYEPEITNYRYAETYLTSREPGSIGRIVLRNAGVGAGKEVMRMNVQGHLPGGCYVSNSGDYEVDIVSLDEDIEEPVNFIKMDIEGFELEALKGAARHIREKKPKLAICVYHKINDLWEIPFLIADLNPEYKLYLRRYHWMNENSETESVIYAV